jgi:hypothetical protein
LNIDEGLTNNQMHALLHDKLGEKRYRVSVLSSSESIESDGGIPISENDNAFNIMEYNGVLKNTLSAEIALLDAEVAKVDEKIATQTGTTNEVVIKDEPVLGVNSEGAPNSIETNAEDKEKTGSEGIKEPVPKENNSETENEDTLSESDMEVEKAKIETEVKPTTKPNDIPTILTIVLTWEPEITNAMFDKAISTIGEDESTKPNEAELNFEIELTRSIEMFLAEEEISQDNAWFCPTCKQLSPIKKQLSLTKLPHLLVLHLKRFEYTLLYRQKITTLVKYPLLNLDLSAYVNNADVEEGNNPHTSYNLFAVSNHMGGLSGGHYTAYVKKEDADQQANNGDSQWFEINDSSSSAVNSSKVCSRSGYLLFYHSNSCQCDHVAELTHILDVKMAMNMDKKLAKEVQETDVSQQFEVADNATSDVTGELISQPNESSNNRKAKREEDSNNDGVSHKKPKRNGNGNNPRLLSERRSSTCIGGGRNRFDQENENYMQLGYDAANGSISKGPAPIRNTITCILCNCLVASNDDQYVNHLFEKHSEQDALFALSALGHGDDNGMDFQLNQNDIAAISDALNETEPTNNQVNNQVDILAISDALNQTEPTNNQIIQLVQNFSNNNNQKF